MPSSHALRSAALACLVSALAFAADPLDHWHQRDSGTLTNLHAVDWSAEGFVAVGDGGIVLWSNDGTNWVRNYVAPNPNLYSIAHNNAVFAMVGQGGAICTSADGLQVNARISPTTNHLRCVRWLKDRFVAGGDNGTLLVSFTGASWQAVDSGTPHRITALAYGNGLFMAAATAGVNATPVLLSTDAVTWTNDTENFIQLYDLLHHDNRFLGLSYRSRFHTTTNGTDWTPAIYAGDAQYLYALAHQHDRFIAVGAPAFLDGKQKVFSSRDGFSWGRHTFNVNHSGTLRGVAAGSFSVVAVGEGGLIAQSDPTFRLLPRPQFIGGVPHWTLHGQSGRNYRLQAATNAVAGPWEDVLQVEATNDVITLRDPTTPLLPCRFYRVATP